MAENKTLTMSVKERLVMPSFFPQRSNIMNQVIAEEIGAIVKIDKDEEKAIDLKVVGNGMKWDEEKCVDKIFEFTEVQAMFLKDQVAKFDKDEQISREQLSLARKIKDL